jgi:hypothetical protein
MYIRNTLALIYLHLSVHLMTFTFELLVSILLLRDNLSPEVVLSTSVSPLSGRHSVTFNTLFIILSLPIAFKKVLPRTTCILLIECGTIEVIEHEVHVLSLFPLQMIYNVLISVNFNFDMSISLARKGSRFGELLVVLFALQILLIVTSKLDLFLLLLLLVVRYVKGLSAKLVVVCRCLRVGFAANYMVRVYLRLLVYSSVRVESVLSIYIS